MARNVTAFGKRDNPDVVRSELETVNVIGVPGVFAGEHESARITADHSVDVRGEMLAEFTGQRFLQHAKCNTGLGRYCFGHGGHSTDEPNNRSHFDAFMTLKCVDLLAFRLYSLLSLSFISMFTFLHSGAYI